MYKQKTLIIFLAGLIFSNLACVLPAQARLGERFTLFKLRELKGAKQTGQVSGLTGTTINYMFALPRDAKKDDGSPGYAIGVTVTVSNGIISGQSMAIRPGSNTTIGDALACVDAFRFAYEAIGKPIPAKKEQAEQDYKEFADRIGQAFNGRPQTLRWRDIKAQVTASLDPQGNMLLAALPAQD
jgi:hypothetical protein